ncbi:hypothetical protein R1flu_027260 [Riccia fluitans]|uniref:Uncharacterized protein n=1 Tax=Riccia fluitans TaxID=41844 RepID=A0ABD1XIC2_9MARC
MRQERQGAQRWRGRPRMIMARNGVVVVVAAAGCGFQGSNHLTGDSESPADMQIVGRGESSRLSCGLSKVPVWKS